MKLTNHVYLVPQSKWKDLCLQSPSMSSRHNAWTQEQLYLWTNWCDSLSTNFSSSTVIITNDFDQCCSQTSKTRPQTRNVLGDLALALTTNVSPGGNGGSYVELTTHYVWLVRQRSEISLNPKSFMCLSSVEGSFSWFNCLKLGVHTTSFDIRNWAFGYTVHSCVSCFSQ